MQAVQVQEGWLILTACSAPPLLTGSACQSTRLGRPISVRWDDPAASSGRVVDPPGAVFVPQRGQVRPARSFSRALRVGAALRAAAEGGAEARADGAGQQHEHDAVGCSLRGVTDSLQNHYQIYIHFWNRNIFL